MDKITINNFDEVIKEGVVLVDFYAEWCGPCKMMSPILEEIGNEMSQVSIVKVNVDEEQKLAMRYNVMSIPTLILFKNGEKIQQVMGFNPKEMIVELIKKAV